MKKLLLYSFILVLTLLSLGVQVLFAQERQVPFDAEGKYLTISPEQERMLNLFPEYPNFIQARLFQTPDSAFILEVLHFVGDSVNRQRLPMNLAKLQDLRKRFVQALRKMIPDLESTLAGIEKTGTVLANTVLGLGYGVAGVFGANSLNAASIAVPILYCGGSIWATSQPWFNRSSLVMLENGLTVGSLHGVALAGLFASQSTAKFMDYWVPGIAMGVVEAGVGMFAVDKFQLSYGQTTLMTELGFSGLLTGIGTGFLVAPNNLNVISGAALLGSGLGIYTGVALSQGQTWANGDGLVFGALSPLGLILPSALTFLGVAVPPFDARVLLGTSIVSHLGAYALGSIFVHQKDFSYPQGFAIAGATSLGMLAGLGAFLISQPDAASRYALGLSLLGGGVGFALSYSQYAEQAKLQAELNSLDGTSAKHSLLNKEQSWLDEFSANTKIAVSPIGLLSLVLPQMQVAGVLLPIVNIHYTFR